MNTAVLDGHAVVDEGAVLDLHPVADRHALVDERIPADDAFGPDAGARPDWPPDARCSSVARRSRRLRGPPSHGHAPRDRSRAGWAPRGVAGHGIGWRGADRADAMVEYSRPNLGPVPAGRRVSRGAGAAGGRARTTPNAAPKASAPRQSRSVLTSPRPAAAKRRSARSPDPCHPVGDDRPGAACSRWTSRASTRPGVALADACLAGDGAADGADLDATRSARARRRRPG